MHVLSLKTKKRPGSYADELNKVLSVNNLPNIIIPEESVEQHMGAASLEPVQVQTPKQAQSLSRQSSVSNISVSSEAASSKKLKATDLGLKFYTTKTKGWPQNFSTVELVKGIKSKQQKWTYTNTKYDEEQILHKTEKGEIILTNCFFAVEEDEFRKIKNGLIQERSPVEQRDLRYKRPTHI